MDVARPAGIDLPPVAALLMQSLRAVGYTTSAALADLVDNSIAADAKNVAIRLSIAPEPYVAVVDDGHGMAEAALVAAMRFGSCDPRDRRTGMDLGRFGLGLKTASLSQCRRLTVASLVNGRLSIARWDVDECEQRGSWWLEKPDPPSLPEGIVDQLHQQGRGTAVIWTDLDRLTATGGSDPRRAIQMAIEDAADHLAMVFHRFLAGEITPGFSMTLNERPLSRAAGLAALVLDGDRFVVDADDAGVGESDTKDVAGEIVEHGLFALPQAVTWRIQGVRHTAPGMTRFVGGPTGYLMPAGSKGYVQPPTDFATLALDEAVPSNLDR